MNLQRNCVISKKYCPFLSVYETMKLCMKSVRLPLPAKSDSILKE